MRKMKAVAPKSIDEIQADIERIRSAQREREAVSQPPAPTPPTATAKVIRLPVWPENTRGVPNIALRSALFGAIRRGKRAFLQGVRKGGVEGITVLYTGPQLDQADLDVWEQCLHLAKQEALGERIEFTAHSFLKAIGRTAGGKDVEWLKGVFRRLMAAVVELSDGKRAYAGQLIHHWNRDEVTGHHVIEMNPKISALYTSDGWTQVDNEQRQSLKGHPLAQWLHGFYSTHAEPYAYKVETLHEVCGSENEQLAGFRRELREALSKVAEVTGWKCDIDDKDLVRVEKPRKSRGRKPLTNK